MKAKLRFLIVAILVLGIFFRFLNIDKKIYWFDETFTSFRIAGYTETEAIAQLSEQKVIGIEDLQKYQRLNPSKTVVDTIKGLALEEPQLPPLYFVLTRFWVQMWGSTPTVTRSFSALISLLAFPCLYWLCRELFEPPLVAWVAIAIVAVSPFHILYAQEARPYSLWIVTILLSSASLLRAMRLKTRGNWTLYAITTALGLYTHLFSGLVVIAHAIYLVATAGFRFTKDVANFLIASFAAILTFSPWVVLFLINLRSAASTTSWQSERLREPILSKLVALAASFSRTYIDFGFNSSTRVIYLIPLAPAILILFSILAYSIYFLCRHTRKEVWLFILSLMCVNAITLILPDLILGGNRSAHSRYLLPWHLGNQLALSYLIATQITTPFVKVWRQKFWQIIAIALLSVGIISCAISASAEAWWSKGLNDSNRPVANIINTTSRPLVLSELSRYPLFNLISVSHILDSKVKFLIVKPTVPIIPDGFSDVFVYVTSKSLLRRKLAESPDYKIEPVYKDENQDETWLWKLEKI
ncbi:glycosyltransferase family 39 protein [Microcoleus sp. FACHB-831]|uniref:glycosyltransferase family 39 protein n=1 Tax=Microcoleus sp. FACHB-831 TaxID=2692827 RepID=UPI001683D3CE|nr:glycosyltransferase family 39 protein [Microcoleus sp. FACHB-831]MBD1922883.1 glycosyltransferase family 39 protein [Microcoleus sp. FACHB-831]